MTRSKREIPHDYLGNTLRETVIDAILAVAPEADIDALPPTAPGGRRWRSTPSTS